MVAKYTAEMITKTLDFSFSHDYHQEMMRALVLGRHYKQPMDSKNEQLLDPMEAKCISFTQIVLDSANKRIDSLARDVQDLKTSL